ncbi:MAG TPA: hypothetical protein VFN23_04725, partial [Ktedonobacteraceae bacterium]|nr:hypothetical protein [Ktedonobacteraceae bacterium]
MNKNLGYRILQLESNNISEGFSGAPVWDDARRCVIGMITEIKVPDKYGRLGHISFAVPSTYLQELSNLPVKPATVLHSLTPLTEAEAHLFVGDQDTMNRLAWRLQDREHFLVILGADAVGKTSTIQAGLIPQMRNGVIHGYEEWGFLSVTLSENPFIELETQGLAEASVNLLESIHAWCQKNACPKMVLIIDKFEEVLQTCPEPLQTHFISQLTTIIENGEATIILILRDDFYHLLARHKPLITYVEESIVNVVPPHTHANLVEIAQKHAAAYNTNVDPRFIESVIDKVKRSFEATPNQSSLIQLYAMQWMHIWKQFNNPGMLDASTINIDTLPENTADLAEKLFETLTQQEQNFVQHAFISLVKPGNPTTSIPDICRTLPLITLCQNELEQEILYRFADAGLLMTGRDLQTNAEVISISQSSLLTTWPRLKEWLAQEREFYLWRGQLRARLAQQPNISSTQALLSQNELLQARFWFNQREAELTQSEKSLIQVSITQQNQAKRQEQQEKRSMLQRQHAHSIELAQQAHTLRNQAGPSLETSVLLAIEAMRSFPCPEAYQALYQSLILLPRLEWHLTHPGKIATSTFSRSGSYLVTVDEHTIGVIGLKKGSSVASHLQSPTPICNSALSLNERYLATASDDEYVIIWDLQQGKIRFPMEQNNRVHLVALSSDTSYPLTSLAEKAPIQILASASLDGPIFIAPVDPGEQQYRYTLKPGSPIHTMAFHPTSPHLVTASKAGRVQIWNAVTGHRIGQIKIPGQVSLLAFSQQGEYLAIINDEGLL